MRLSNRSILLVVSMSAMSVIHPLAAPAKSGFCNNVKAVNDAANALDSFGTDTTKGVKAFDNVIKKMKAASGSAPSDIKADWSKLSVAFDKLGGLMKKLTVIKATDTNATKTKDKLQAELTKVMSDPTTEKADKHITAWAMKECGIDLNN